MASEDAVRRHGHRAGYRLLTYRDVALPLWKLNLRCRVLEQRQIPPIEEFVLKSIREGLSLPDDVGEFLGLEDQLLTGVVAEMSREDLIALRSNSDQLSLHLTPKGSRALAEASLSSPEERHYPVYFDGLTRRLVIPHTPLERPQDVAARGLLEIPAVPADPPAVGELSREELTVLLREQSPREQKWEVLSIEAIAGRRERSFVASIALVFQAEATGEVQVGFLIDGRPSLDHETAFAAAEGARRIGILRRLREDDAIPTLLPPEVLRQATDSDEARQLRQAAEAFSQVVDEERERLTTATVEVDREEARSRLDSAEVRLAAIDAELKALPVRQLEVFEHPALLQQALGEATRRLLIVSPWIRAAVVNDDFLLSLRGALERGVEVLIGYGLGADEWMPPRDEAARENLISLAGEFTNLAVADLGDTHAKVLLVDNRFVVVTSFNWLSFRGDPNKPFRDERGMLVAVPEIIEKLYSDYAARIAGDAT